MKRQPEWVWLDAIMASMILSLFAVDRDMALHPVRNGITMGLIMLIGFGLIVWWLMSNAYALSYVRGRLRLIEHDAERRIWVYRFDVED